MSNGLDPYQERRSEPWSGSKLFAKVIFSCFLLSADFLKLTFSKNSFRNTIRVSNGLDPDQDRRSAGPDLGPNCLQKLKKLYAFVVVCYFKAWYFRMLTALYCVTMIHQLFQGRACTTQFLSNFEITKCCGYREYKVKITFLSKQCIYASLVQKNHWFRRQSSEKAEFTVFLRMMTLKWDALEN